MELSAIFFLLCRWPVVVPLGAVAAYFALRNRRQTASAADRFFAGFGVGGHRGSPRLQPENTMPSFERARAEGADLVEFDVALTRDARAVLLHDDTLDRTTDLRGAVRDRRFEQLRHANCAANFRRHLTPDQQALVRRSGSDSDAVQRTHMPTMDELVAWAKQHKMRMLFDIKDADQELVDQLADVFKRYDIYDLGIVCSFFPTVVYRLKRQQPRILTGLTWRHWFFSYQDLDATEPRFVGPPLLLAKAFDVVYVWSIFSWLPAFLGVDMVLTERRDICSTFVNQQQACGRRVCAWTVNDVSEATWMRNVLKIPILTDLPCMIQSL